MTGDIERMYQSVIMDGRPNTAKHQRRAWLMSAIILFGSLPGFPILWFLSTTGFKVADLSHVAFIPLLTAHHFYYLLPAMIFGPSLFPSEEFGLMPTPGGYAVGAIFYAVMAFALCFPLSWLFSRRGGHNSDRENETHVA